MSDVVFLSGWAGPESLFPGFSGQWTFLAPFFSGDETALLSRLETSSFRVLGGWSTGAHMILKHVAKLLPHFDRVVLAAPFLRFSDSLPRRITAAMARSLTADPKGTVQAFWKNCGVPGSPVWDPEWAGPLAKGLDYLLNSIADPDSIPAAKVTVLAGTGDRIVRRPALQKVLDRLPGARFVSFPGGHYPDPTILKAVLFQ